MISKQTALKLAEQGRLRVDGMRLDFGRGRAYRTIKLRLGTGPLLYVPDLPENQSALDKAILTAIEGS